MNNDVSYQIFIKCVSAIILWAATLSGVICIASDWSDGGFNWAEVWPAILLFGMTARYLYVSIALHGMLKKVRDIERTGET